MQRQQADGIRKEKTPVAERKPRSLAVVEWGASRQWFLRCETVVLTRKSIWQSGGPLVGGTVGSASDWDQRRSSLVHVTAPPPPPLAR